MEFLKKIWDSLVAWFIGDRGWMTLLLLLAVVVVGFIVVKIVIAVARRIMNKSKLKGLAGNFIITILKIVLYFAYLIAILRVLNIDTTSLIAVLASCTLALSLALQTTLSNFASGMILVSNHPFKEGDFVEVAGISGVVKSISLFSTKICTGDNKVVTVPNSNVAGGEIINYSTESKRRVDMTFGVAYGSDMDKVKGLLISELDKHPLVLHDEGYTVRLSEQGASSLNFVCRCWVNNADYWTVFFDMNETMVKRFEEEGIEIPYNKLDVNIVSAKVEEKQ